MYVDRTVNIIFMGYDNQAIDPSADLAQYQSDSVKVATVVGGGGAKDMVKDSVYLNKQYLEDLNQNTIRWVQVQIFCQHCLHIPLNPFTYMMHTCIYTYTCLNVYIVFVLIEFRPWITKCFQY